LMQNEAGKAPSQQVELMLALRRWIAGMLGEGGGGEGEGGGGEGGGDVDGDGGEYGPNTWALQITGVFEAGALDGPCSLTPLNTDVPALCPMKQ